MKRTVFLAWCFTGLALLCQQAKSTVVDKIIWCEGCTAAQKISRIKGDADFGSAPVFYLGSVSGKTIQKFHVTREEKPQGGGYNTLVLPVATEADVTAAFQSLMNFYYAGDIGFTKRFYFQIIDSTNPNSSSYRAYYTGSGFAIGSSTTGPASAAALSGTQVTTPVLNYPDSDVNVYHVVNRSPAQNQLLDFATRGFSGQFNTLSNQAINIASSVLPLDASHLPSIVAVVKFADASQIAIALDSSTTNAHYVIVKDAARDSHNNTVPVTKEMIGGDGVALYDFSLGVGNPTDRARMGNQLSLLGATSGTGGGSLGTGGTHGWACTSSGEGENKVYTCRAY